MQKRQDQMACEHDWVMYQPLRGEPYRCCSKAGCGITQDEHFKSLYDHTTKPEEPPKAMTYEKFDSIVKDVSRNGMAKPSKANFVSDTEVAMLKAAEQIQKDFNWGEDDDRQYLMPGFDPDDVGSRFKIVIDDRVMYKLIDVNKNSRSYTATVNMIVSLKDFESLYINGKRIK